jgi:hypothetical protein
MGWSWKRDKGGSFRLPERGYLSKATGSLWFDEVPEDRDFDSEQLE